MDELQVAGDYGSFELQDDLKIRDPSIPILGEICRDFAESGGLISAQVALRVRLVSSVYGPRTPLTAEETATPDPCNPDALTKLHGEHWGRLYSRLHGLNVRALRFFSVWGPGQRPDLAIESFQRAIERDQPVTILGDGSQRRDLTHVSDVARAVELAIGFHGDGFEAFNVGTGVNHSVMDMLRHSSSKTGKNPVVLHSALHPADVQETLADTRKSYILLEFQPLHPFQI